MGDEVVSVALWRGYVTGRFYARPADRDVALALSPSFRIARWPWEERVSLERNRDAAGALAALQNGLVAAGWERSADVGSRWYERSFRRPVWNGVTPLAHTVNGVHLHVAERAPEPVNGHASGAVAREVVEALQAGPLTSHELCSRVGRSSGTVRVARRELEVAGLVQKAAPPAGRSRRAIYWQLSR